MASTARVWLAGLLGLAIGIAIAELRPRSSLEVRGTTDALSSSASEPRGSALSSLSTPASKTKREAQADAKSSADSPGAPHAVSRGKTSAIVYGHLLEPDGNPILHAKWAWVAFIDRAGRRRNADAQEGAYAIANLPPGSYAVQARADAHREVHDSFELAADYSEVKKDFQLQRAATLRVLVVTPKGEPLVRALEPELMWQIVPVATSTSPGRHVFEVVGSLNNPFGVGQFWQSEPPSQSATPDCIGILRLDVDLPVYVSLVLCHAVLQTKEVAPGEDEVKFVVSPEEVRASRGAVQVQVLDATTAAPLEGVYLDLEGGPSGGGQGKSDPKGIARIDPALPGRFELQIAKEHYEFIRQSVDVEPGTTTDLGTVALGAEIPLELHVVDGRGEPAKMYFRLAVLGAGGRSIEAGSVRGCASDPAGVMKLFGLGRRLYVLQSGNHDAMNEKEAPETTWVSGAVVIDPVASSGRVIELRLEPAVPLAVRVEGRAADGLRFRVIDGQGFPLVQDRFWGPGPRPLRLPAGTYRVQVGETYDKVLAESSVTLAADPVELTIRL